jgi:hypothetical protein
VQRQLPLRVGDGDEYIGMEVKDWK